MIKNKEVKMKLAILIMGIIFLLGLIYLWYGMYILSVSKYKIKSNKISKDLSGYKIAHISDFHNTRSKILKEQILKSLDKEKPDILLITGDFIDAYRTNINIAIDFIKQIKNMPIYYVAGNHESRIKEYNKFKKEIVKLGVNVLENESISIKVKKTEFNIIGLQDPTFETTEKNVDQMKVIVDKYLSGLSNSKRFQILLIHRPELQDIYCKHNIDITVCGHAHGGEFIIPFIGPIIAPNQGFFPKLTSGVHTKNNSNLIISRGIGNSSVPLRFNNNPELIYITLQEK